MKPDPRLLALAAVLVAVAGSGRWLRVAQREHYLFPAVSRFALRWWWSSVPNRVLVALALATTAASFFDPIWGWLALTATLYGPLGLRLRGTTSPLAWTARLRRLAAVAATVVVGLTVLGLSTGQAGWGVAAVLFLPALVDLSLAWLAPLERRLGWRWIEQARSRLGASGATVVAITGSYGKTTTKGYIGHLLSGWRRTVVSPASFNNRMGLARAINENLGPGTEVFVAEMGTYGRGEIAELVGFVKPDIAIITAIGPVHLERFGREEEIADAKREILAGAEVAVLNVDHEHLARMAREEEGRRKVVTVSARDRSAAVAVVDGVLWLDGQEAAEVGAAAFPANVALAVAAVRELGMPVPEVIGRLPGLPNPPHRRQVSTSERGFVIIDDTYNSNPEGARAALRELSDLPGSGRRVVVTPGMVELGRRQRAENRDFAAAASHQSNDLIIVGRTNRRALLEGARQGKASVTVVPSRPAAVAWVRAHLGPGDAVLYENDLPDHYP